MSDTVIQIKALYKSFKTNSEENKVIPIHKILTKKQEFLNGNIMYVFECQSFINDINKLYAINLLLFTQLFH